MIEVQSLTRLYGTTTAVKNVSFEIGSREIVGLLGHNGAGKTTVMRMLSGYLEPSDGSIRIDGVDPAGESREVQRHLGYLPENLPVYPQMMVADYLDYAATLKGIPASQRITAVRDALLATDLMQRALDPIHVLSRGFRQRVGVAQAILGQPKLLILDEPTNGLDPDQAEHMRLLIKRLARQTTVILSTHIMQEVDAVCDRVLMLRNGQLALDQSLAELHDSRTLVLRTSTTDEPLATYLKNLPQIASMDATDTADGLLHFDLHLHPNADPDTAANNIAQCVLKAGAKLYQLQAVPRDLATVFREVNDSGN
ncbi:putative ABC transporter ATP-binding protein YxlF [Halioglobus japonicus]|nr:putative ABC transporter ATP-binding protein YxlF [Halioglobus japonicus]